MAYSEHKISVFDVDDTLTITDAKVKVKDSITGETFSLTADEYNDFDYQYHHELDFSDFDSYEVLKAGKLIEEYVAVLEKAYNSNKAVSIVTARSQRDLIYQWVKEHVGFHVNRDLIFAVSDPEHGFEGTIPEKKEKAFKEILKMGFTDIEYYDDSIKNVRQIRKLLKGQGVKFKIVHVK